MKKLLSAFLAAAMLLPLAACASPASLEDTAGPDHPDHEESPDPAGTGDTGDTSVSPDETEAPASAFAAFPAAPRVTPDASVTRLLAENILTAPDAETIVYDLLDVDSLSGKMGRLLSDDQTKLHKKSLRWRYRDLASLAFVPEGEDLSAYEGFSFWMYADESAVGQTFLVCLGSDNPDTEGSDYYSTNVVKIAEAGWTCYSWKLDRLGAARSPLGFDHISQFSITSTGWGQANDPSTVLYLDNIRFYSNMDAVNPLAAIPQLAGAAVFCVGGSRAAVDQKLVKISARDDASVPFEEDGTLWLPLAPLAAVRCPGAEYNAASATLRMTLGDREYTFTAGVEDSALGGAPRLRGDSLFAPLDAVRELFGFREAWRDGMGLVILSDEAAPFDEEKNLTTLFGIARELVFVRPDAETLLGDMSAHLGEKDVHPRILADADDFASFAASVQKDARHKTLLNKLKQTYGVGAAEYLAAPLTYQLVSDRLLNVSNQAFWRIGSWATLYRATGDERYAERAWRELEAVCAFADWHPDHFLDTGVMCAAVAIGYDWLYDFLTPERRKTVEEALLEKGVRLGLDVYEGRRGIWGDNNWSGVCNGGLTAAAAALAGVYPEECGRLISFCLTGVEGSMLSYAPDGGYVESPGYWTFGTRFMCCMIGALEKSCGTDYGLYASPGFAASAYYTAYFETEMCSWNFHDGSRNRTETDFLLWFARRSHDPDISCLRLTGVERGIKPVSFFDVFFYDADNVSPSLSLPLDAYYSNVGAVTMRSTWEDRATFVGLCGGSNSVAHGDLDIGNFVIDGDGCRFLDDLGSDNYGLPGYFVASRWTYYRKRAEGQNTLVIGAVSRNTPDQAPTANGRFTRVESSASSSIAVVDMAAAYTQVTEGQRGIFFRDNRTTIVVQDEIRLDTPEIVRWQVHTRGRIAVSADGRTAVITDNGRRLYCEIVAQDASLRFTTRAAESYDPYYKDTEGEYDRSYLTKLCIITEEVTDFTCAVAFRVLKNGEAAPEAGTLYRLVPIRDWTPEP